MRRSSSKRALAYTTGIFAVSLLGCTPADENTTDASSVVGPTPVIGADGSVTYDGGLRLPDASYPVGDSGVYTPPATSAGAIPCDVQAILTSNCAMCHGATTAYGAPMSLATLSDFQKTALTGAKMVDAIKGRINETDPTKAMPPSTGTKLTSAQLTTLNNWLAQGAPAGTSTCTPTTTDPTPVDPTTPADKTGLDCFKLTAHGATADVPYKVGTAVDSYFNFKFQAPWTGTRYGVLFTPIIDNKKALHHFLLFQNGSAGATSGAVKSSGAHPDGQLVYGWAPGGQPLDFRVSGDVGYELSAGVSYTIEYHYNSSDSSAMDASGVELCMTKNKPTNIAGISWLGYDNLLIPSTTWTGQCVPQNTQPVHILGVQPHMHVTGRHMKAVIHRKGGGDEVLHDEPFDFNNQIHYLKDVTINPGDTITTTCTYSQPMSFGESTGQEMCYLFTFAYAKGQLKDSGSWGGVAHGGSACLGQ